MYKKEAHIGLTKKQVIYMLENGIDWNISDGLIN